MSDFSIGGTVSADDQASATLTEIGRNVQTLGNDLETTGNKATVAASKMQTSFRGLITGMSSVAVSAFSMYQSFDRYQDMTLQVNKANLAVKSTLNSAGDAQRTYNATVAKYGATSTQAKAALADLRVAQERHTLAVERAEMVQDNQNKAIIQMAVMAVPQAITMVDGLSKAWKNFPDMTGFLKNMSSNISNVGLTAKSAALGVGAFIGGFLIGYTAMKNFGDALGPVGRALLVIIPIIIAAAAAIWAMQSGWTMGLALVALAATGIAVGALVAQLEETPKTPALASGGIVKKPTVALIGEAGPEAVIPLSQLNQTTYGNQTSTTFGARTLTFNIYESKSPRDTADEILDKMRRAGAA